MKSLLTELQQFLMIVCLQESGHPRWNLFQVPCQQCLDSLDTADRQIFILIFIHQVMGFAQIDTCRKQVNRLIIQAFQEEKASMMSRGHSLKDNKRLLASQIQPLPVIETPLSWLVESYTNKKSRIVLFVLNSCPDAIVQVHKPYNVRSVIIW